MKPKLAAVLFGSLLVGLLALSHQSLWIDEGFTARYALAPTLSGYWHMLATSGPPDVQMLLYTLQIWVWGKCFGLSEWALRSANLPWFLIAQGAYWCGLRRWPRLQFAAVVCGAFDPFIWRYLDEIRPYAMEYAGSAATVSCLAYLGAEEEPVIGAGHLLSIGAALFLLCGGSSLGIPWAGSALLAYIFLSWSRARIIWSPSTLAAGLSSLLAILSLAGYYLWTIEVAARGQGVGGAPNFGHRFSSLLFAAYELFGFSGLGPDKLSVSADPGFRLFVPYLGALLPLGVLLAGTIVISVRALRSSTNPRLIQAGAIYLLLPLAFLLLLVCRLDWHAVGRHFTPVSPVIILLVALAVASAWRKRSRWQIEWTSATIALWMVCCLEVRLAPRHLRDDYRGAVQEAIASLAQGKRVWWVAAKYTAEFYHLPMKDETRDGSGAFLLWQPSPQVAAELPPPDIVLLSKPLIFDSKGAVADYLVSRHYRLAGTLPAFSIWKK